VAPFDLKIKAPTDANAAPVFEESAKNIKFNSASRVSDAGSRGGSLELKVRIEERGKLCRVNHSRGFIRRCARSANAANWIAVNETDRAKGRSLERILRKISPLLIEMRRDGCVRSQLERATSIMLVNERLNSRRM